MRDDQEIRAKALECASRVHQPAGPYGRSATTVTVETLQIAKQFEEYIRNGSR